MQLPTRDNSAVLLLDLQDEIVKNSRTVSVEQLRRTTGALSKLAALHQLPVFYRRFRLAASSLIATALLRVVPRPSPTLSEVQARDLTERAQHQTRALLAERAVAQFFFAVVSFAIAGFAIAIDHWADDTLTWLPFLMTSIGMGLIAVGSAAMLAECRLAAAQIRAEIAAWPIGQRSPRRPRY